MHLFNDKRTSLASLGLVAGLALSLTASCDPGESAEKLCGPCGTIASGQVSVSGNAQLDGFFSAVADLQNASASVRGNFDAEIRALAAIYGRADAEVNADLVAALIADIRADINASVSGSFRLQYQPPRCSASVDLAIEAQADCEVNAGCEVEATPPSASVECSGQCTGSCSGACEGGTVSCTPPSGSINCDVGCEGECALTAAAECNGTCNGTCNGECTLVNADGQCQGECNGTCEGSCQAEGMAQCNGTCHGTCHASVTPPECEAQPITCSAQCMGECSGGCNGDFVAPSASADCDASADCQAQASAKAEANVECTPPSLEFGFELDAGLSGEARAQFLARLDAVRVHLAGAMQAAAQARALIDGEVNGEVVFNPSPVANITGSLRGFINGGASGFAELDIPAGRLPCVIPAFEAAVSALGDAGTDLTFTAQASVELFAFVANPTG